MNFRRFIGEEKKVFSFCAHVLFLFLYAKGRYVIRVHCIYDVSLGKSEQKFLCTQPKDRYLSSLNWYLKLTWTFMDSDQPELIPVRWYVILKEES